MYLNEQTILGFVGQTAEVTELKSGTKVTKFSVATKVTWTDKESGDRKERSQWHHIVAYGDHFPKFADRIVKGAYVLVQGELLTRSYEKTIQVTVGKKTVDQTIKALAVELKADTIKLLDRSNSTEEQPSDEQPPY